MSLELIIAAIAIAFLAAACYAVTGFGFALVMTPLLTLAWDVKSAVAASVILATVTLIPLLIEARSHVEVSRVVTLTLSSIAGIPLGLALLDRLDSDALSVMIAVTVVASSLLLYFTPRIGGDEDKTAGRIVAGFMSGALGASTSMGGPPVVLYLLNRVREVRSFRATLIAYFLPGNALTVLGFAAVGRLTEDVLVLCLATVPALVLGLTAGAAVRHRIPPERFRTFVVALLVVTSVGVLLSVLF